jgi:glutathione S-transferase
MTVTAGQRPSQELQRLRPEPGGALMVRRVLHQFPLSPFCEKTRWNLDLKGLDYTVRNLFPGRHARINRRLVPGRSSVPLLIDRELVIHDSSAIALYLEETYPGKPLLPGDDGLRSLVLALENYFDSSVGPSVRHWCYGQLLGRRGRATEVFFAEYSSRTRWLMGHVLGRLFERRLAATFPPDAEALEQVERIMLEGLERLENVTERDPDRYLVGEGMTLADVTAAALLAPIIGPPNSPWSASEPLTAPMLEMRERLRARPGGQWVLRRYAHDRPVAAGPLATGERVRTS